MYVCVILSNYSSLTHIFLTRVPSVFVWLLISHLFFSTLLFSLLPFPPLPSGVDANVAVLSPIHFNVRQIFILALRIKPEVLVSSLFRSPTLT